MSGEIPGWLKEADRIRQELAEQQALEQSQVAEARRLRNEKVLSYICSPAFETALETARIWDELDADSTLRDIQNFLGKQESSSSTELVFTRPSENPRDADFGVGLRPIDKALDKLKRVVSEDWCRFYAPRSNKPPYGWDKIELGQIKNPVKSRFLYIDHEIYDYHEWKLPDWGGTESRTEKHFALRLRPGNTIEVRIGEGEPQNLHGKIQTPDQLRQGLGDLLANSFRK